MDRIALGSTLALLLATAACETGPRTGNGAVFRVRAAMTSNSCGAGAPSAQSSFAFDAEVILSAQQSLTWRIPAARISAQTTLDVTTGAFRLVDDRVVVVRAADPRRELGVCALRRFDVIEGRIAGQFPALDPLADSGGRAVDPLADAMVDADAMRDPVIITDAGVDGGARRSGYPGLDELRESVGYAVVPGADCRDIVGVGPSQFIALPCQMNWTMSAEWNPEAAVSR
ncbi:MAG: hypothetical protein JNK05_29705 [Myxococcales bacterium]|nr:hypothetical protein [Myxococcales bacterium]